MAQKSKKNDKSDVRSTRNTKSNLVQKNTKRQMYAKIATAKINQIIHLDDFNHRALETYRTELNNGKKTFLDTADILESKYMRISESFANSRYFQKYSGIKNLKNRKTYLETLQVMYQSIILKLMSKIEHAEILDLSGKSKDAIMCYFEVLDHVDSDSKYMDKFQVLKDNPSDKCLTEVFQLRLISFYGLFTVDVNSKSKFVSLNGSLENLNDCLKIYEDYPQLKKEKMEFFHRTEDFSDLWSEIVSAKRKTEKLIVKRRFKLKQNSKMISAFARKSFS